ncbi:MAG: hypothetical protein R2758_17430, partial [Bacteroidales bacterium]
MFLTLLMLILAAGNLTLTGQEDAGQRNPEGVAGRQILQSERMKAVITADGLESVTDPLDRHGADIVSHHAPWGRIKLVYRKGHAKWTERPSGEPPYLMILPGKGTGLEYFDGG